MKRRTVLSESQLRRIVRQIIRENDVGLYPAVPRSLSDEETMEPGDHEDHEDDKNMHVGMYPAVPPPVSDRNAGMYPAVGGRVSK